MMKFINKAATVVAGVLVMVAIMQVGATALLGTSTVVQAVNRAVDGEDGMTVTINPYQVITRKSNGDAGFVLSLSDANANDVVSYNLGGIDNAWSVQVNGTVIQSSGTDINGTKLYSISASALQNGQVEVLPPLHVSGKLENVYISRNSSKNASNLITDFMNGTFDYPEAFPELDTDAISYTYHNPQQTQVDFGATHYTPSDGQYSIWPSGHMSGPGDDWPYWVDLRSVDNPYSGSGLYQTYTMISESDAAAVGKLLIINATDQMPLPNTFIKTSTIAVEPNTVYDFSGYFGNLGSSLDPNDDKQYNPDAEFIVHLADGSEFSLATTGLLPFQDLNAPNNPLWNQYHATFNTGANTSVYLEIRNHQFGGIGNDIAIDNLTLKAQPKTVFDLAVGDWSVNKTADTDQIFVGGTVEYTIDIANNSDADLTGLVFNDDLSDVLDDATYNNDATATSGTVSYNNGVLTWSGDLAAGATAQVTYTVTVSYPEVTGNGILANVVVTEDGGNCPTGSTEPECNERTPIGNWALKKSVDRETTAAGEVVTYTIEATNIGEIDLIDKQVLDDMTDVEDDATYNNDVTVSSGTAEYKPFFYPYGIVWNGDVLVGETITITYSVTVNDPLSGDGFLRNTISTGEAGGSNCHSRSTDPVCSTDTPIDSPKTTDPADETLPETGNMNLELLFGGLILIASGAVIVIKRVKE